MNDRFEINLNLAKKVLTSIKEQVTSTHDLISRLELPTLALSEFELYKAKYGNQFLSYIDHLLFERNIRGEERISNARLILNANGVESSENTIIYLANCMMGAGECAETSNMALISLIEQNCESLINIVTTTDQGSGGVPYFHMFVVIGDCKVLKNGQKIQEFSQLDSDCVLLDPLLNITGSAREINSIEVERQYMEIFKTKIIYNVLTINPNEHQVKQLAEETIRYAKMLSTRWQEEIGTYKNRKQAAWENTLHTTTDATSIAVISKLNALEGKIAYSSLFNASGNEAIKTELKRICNSQSDWKFTAKQSVFFLISDEETLKTIAAHLNLHQVHCNPVKKLAANSSFCLVIPSGSVAPQNLAQIPCLKSENSLVEQAKI